MALTPVVTKAGVRRIDVGMSSVSVTLTLTDDAGPGLVTTHSQIFKAGMNIADLAVEFVRRMQADIDAYKGERAIFNSAVFSTAVTAMQNGLVV